MAFVLLLQAGLDVLADVQMFIVIEVHAPGAPFEGLMSCCAAGRHRPLILENRPRGVPRPICLETSSTACFLGKLFTAKDAKEREGKQSINLVIKITDLVIASGFTLVLISLAALASLAVQMLDLES